MVKLRLIHGGKESKKLETRSVRLFSAYSLVDDFKGHDHVRLNWIYLERSVSTEPYARLIDGYAQINERVRTLFEQYVNELFTEQEIDLLGKHLRQNFGANFTAVEESVPLSSVFMPTPFRQIKPGGPRGFFKPAGAREANWPFDFCGYYDLSNCPPGLDIEPEAAENGVEFLRESLKNLKMNPAVYEPLL